LSISVPMAPRPQRTTLTNGTLERCRLITSFLPSGSETLTFSIVARDERTGEIGVAVQSHWFSVGSIVSWAQAGVGAVATQANAEVRYGPLGIERMAHGMSAPDALASLLKEDSEAEDRQVAMVDAHGSSAAHTGRKCMPEAGHIVGKGFSCQGNIMKNNRVWGAMAKSFKGTGELPLQDRLMASLEAAQREGGDLRGKQSAAIIVVGPKIGNNSWEGRVVDLRVEDSPEPLKELKRLIGYSVGYSWMNRGDGFLSEGKLDDALDAYSNGMRHLPKVLEAKYWVAIGLLSSGADEKRGMKMLKEVCAKDRNWVQVTKGIVRTQSPKLDPKFLELIG
jgi:uncharacterized Ntn-hydrolase superfamily protein